MPKSFAERLTAPPENWVGVFSLLIGQGLRTAFHTAIVAWVCLKVFIGLGYVLAIVEVPDEAPAQMHVTGQDYGRS